MRKFLRHIDNQYQNIEGSGNGCGNDFSNMHKNLNGNGSDCTYGYAYGHGHGDGDGFVNINPHYPFALIQYWNFYTLKSSK